MAGLIRSRPHTRGACGRETLSTTIRYLPLVWSRDGRRGANAMLPVAEQATTGGATLTLAELIDVLRARPAPACAVRLDFGPDGMCFWDADGVTEGDAASHAAATLRTDLGTLAQVRAAELDPRIAFMAGRLAVEGEPEAKKEVYRIFA